ncbi:MAG: hypothetical protein JW384_01502 [Nitrosomonadaceae bacterium]|nr:hypothetical protein [Nitrosomonadaceae bacterium]
MTYSNLVKDREFAKTRMPRNTIEFVSDGCTGFKYDVTCELGFKYKLFVYFAVARYRVMVVEPAVERGPLGHGSHVFEDGSLCLEPSMQGCRTLEQAFAKSVLWANGYSVYAHNGKFPFSANNKND